MMEYRSRGRVIGCFESSKISADVGKGSESMDFMLLACQEAAMFDYRSIVWSGGGSCADLTDWVRQQWIRFKWGSKNKLICVETIAETHMHTARPQTSGSK
jgi:hypothetical protein